MQTRGGGPPPGTLMWETSQFVSGWSASGVTVTAATELQIAALASSLRTSRSSSGAVLTILVIALPVASVAELLAHDAFVQPVSRIEQDMRLDVMVHVDVHLANIAHLVVVGDGRIR